MRFNVQVIHPKSGAETTVLIEAEHSEAAREKCNNAGFFVGEITPVRSSKSDTMRVIESLAPIKKPQRKESIPTAAQFFSLLSYVPLAAGLLVTTVGMVQVVADHDRNGMIEIATGLFISAVAAAYKWYWSDNGPWR